MASLTRDLPSRAVCLIRDYSRPITRPDWRTLQKMTTFDLYAHVHLRFQSPLMELIFYNMQYSDWYNIYYTIKLMGIYITSIKYNMTPEEILRIKGMSDAVAYHGFWGDEQ
jgi:hypothetical protein